MGKEIGSSPEAAALNSAAPGEGSVGSYLARQRRLRGMSLEDLAALTKIPRRSLERLEAGVFDRTPDGFARGFVRTVAGALGLDPDEAVNRLLAEPREDEAQLRAGARRDYRQLLLLAGLVTAALVGLLILWQLGRLGLAREVSSGDPVVYRHDAVRALAEEPRGEAAAESRSESLAEPGTEPPLEPGTGSEPAYR